MDATFYGLKQAHRLKMIIIQDVMDEALDAGLKAPNFRGGRAGY
jgi:hypothetical protein